MLRCNKFISCFFFIFVFFFSLSTQSMEIENGGDQGGDQGGPVRSRSSSTEEGETLALETRKNEIESILIQPKVPRSYWPLKFIGGGFLSAVVCLGASQDKLPLSIGGYANMIPPPGDVTKMILDGVAMAPWVLILTSEAFDIAFSLGATTPKEVRAIQQRLYKPREKYTWFERNSYYFTPQQPSNCGAYLRNWALPFHSDLTLYYILTGLGVTTLIKLEEGVAGWHPQWLFITAFSASWAIGNVRVAYQSIKHPSESKFFRFISCPPERKALINEFDDLVEFALETLRDEYPMKREFYRLALALKVLDEENIPEDQTYQPLQNGEEEDAVSEDDLSKTKELETINSLKEIKKAAPGKSWWGCFAPAVKIWNRIARKVSDYFVAPTTVAASTVGMGATVSMVTRNACNAVAPLAPYSSALGYASMLPTSYALLCHLPPKLTAIVADHSANVLRVGYSEETEDTFLSRFVNLSSYYVTSLVASPLLNHLLIHELRDQWGLTNPVAQMFIIVPAGMTLGFVLSEIVQPSLLRVYHWLATGCRAKGRKLGCCIDQKLRKEQKLATIQALIHFKKEGIRLSNDNLRIVLGQAPLNSLVPADVASAHSSQKELGSLLRNDE